MMRDGRGCSACTLMKHTCFCWILSRVIHGTVPCQKLQNKFVPQLRGLRSAPPVWMCQKDECFQSSHPVAEICVTVFRINPWRQFLIQWVAVYNSFFVFQQRQLNQNPTMPKANGKRKGEQKKAPTSKKRKNGTVFRPSLAKPLWSHVRVLVVICVVVGAPLKPHPRGGSGITSRVYTPSGQCPWHMSTQKHIHTQNTPLRSSKTPKRYRKISCITQFMYNTTPLVQTLKCGTKFLSLV